MRPPLPSLNKAKDLIKNFKKGDFKFTVEEMIDYGKKEIKILEDAPVNLRTEHYDGILKFHKFTVEMLEYEWVWEKDKVFKMLNMKQHARMMGRDLKIFKTRDIRKPVKKIIEILNEADQPDSLEMFYYRTGLRYLIILGLR